jgi:hypothetical protein
MRFEMQARDHNVLFQPRRQLTFWPLDGSSVHLFRLIKLTIAYLFKMLYQDWPNVLNWFISTFSSS